MFLQRLGIFSEDNEYYKQGGEFNIYEGDIRMPNCTPYVYMRMQEAMELAKRNAYLIRESGGFGHAKTWYDTTPLPKGKTLKEGAGIVFDGNYGHVAFVEEMIDNTHAIISQSQYDSNKSLRNYKYWETREVELVVGKATLSGIGKLIGFIYPEINDIRVERNKSKEQIEITESMVNVRTEPNGSVFSKGLYVPRGIYNVSNKRNVSGYEWYELEPNHWVREGEWLTHYAMEDTYSDLYWEVVNENTELKERLSQIGKLAEVD